MVRPSRPRGLLHGLRPVSAAQFRAVPPAASPVIAAPHWLLELVVAGALEVAVESTGWRRRTAGTGVLYAPGARYRERLARGQRPAPYTSLYVFFEDDSGELRRLLPIGRRFLWVEDGGQLLESRLREVVTGLDGGPAAALSAAGSLCQAVGLLLAAEARKDGLVIGQHVAAIPELIARLHRYMRENLSRPVRLADLADCAGLSESGLSHAYRRITGRTPMAALRALRIEAAKRHLVRGQLKLHAIAALTGFADGFHLSRTFKRVTGRSPREFLKSLLAAAQPTP